MRTDKGKPSGIMPSSIRFADEAVNGDHPNWYQAHMLWDYYDWEHYAGSLMLDQLLFTYILTDDELLLQPMFQTLQLIRTEKAKVVTFGQEPSPLNGEANTRTRRATPRRVPRLGCGETPAMSLVLERRGAVEVSHGRPARG